MMKIAYFMCEVQHNDTNTFETLNEVDPLTGSFRIKAIATVLKPNMIHEITDEMFDELIAADAIREPSEIELVSWKLANGLLVEKVIEGI